MKYGLRRAQPKTTIRWLLKRRGMEAKDTFSYEGRKRLRELRLQEVDFRLDELELVGSIIERLDSQIANAVPMDQNAKLLDTLPGVGPHTAPFLSSSTGDINRFQDSKHLAAYLGLAPSMHQSGDVSLMGHITKTGDRFLRRNMRLKRERGEKKATTEVARKLTPFAYSMLKRSQTYEELSPWSMH
ncbi:MAG: IS110 family transposase [Nitrososphaerota archaeon]|nr:IS110 family transposase [Nitrososphaerota archaeon]MDG7024569.1 IS110 family transposase [Nitrososphaerota archaeon]